MPIFSQDVHRALTELGRLRFVKGHGTENDFVLLPDLDGTLELTAPLVRALCDRRRGVGGDGVLRVVPSRHVPEASKLAAAAQWFMDYRNADGSLAEMCGNGVRVYVRYLLHAGLASPGTLALATRGGIRTVQAAASGDITVDMGVARLLDVPELTVAVAGWSRPALAVSMGNPHVVVAVPTVADAGELRQAPTVCPARAFADGTNVEFVADRGPGRIEMRVFERGAGETRSCGTGAAAAAVAAARWWGGGAPAAYDVRVPGGELRVRQAPNGAIQLTGAAVLVASGVLDAHWLAAVPAE